jgi:hypothetical protein
MNLNPIESLQDRLKNKLEEKAAIKSAEKDMRLEIRQAYIDGMRDEKLKQAYEKGKAKSSGKRLGFLSNIIKPFTPEELKQFSNQSIFNQSPNQNPTPNQRLNPNPNMNFIPIIMTRELEAIYGIRGKKKND